MSDIRLNQFIMKISKKVFVQIKELIDLINNNATVHMSIWFHKSNVLLLHVLKIKLNMEYDKFFKMVTNEMFSFQVLFQLHSQTSLLKLMRKRKTVIKH